MICRLVCMWSGVDSFYHGVFLRLHPHPPAQARSCRRRRRLVQQKRHGRRQRRKLARKRRHGRRHSGKLCSRHSVRRKRRLQLPRRQRGGRRKRSEMPIESWPCRYADLFLASAPMRCWKHTDRVCLSLLVCIGAASLHKLARQHATVRMIVCR